MIMYTITFLIILNSHLISQNYQVLHTETHLNGNIKSITNHLKHGKGIRKWSREEYDKDKANMVRNALDLPDEPMDVPVIYGKDSEE